MTYILYLQIKYILKKEKVNNYILLISQISYIENKFTKYIKIMKINKVKKKIFSEININMM